MEKIKIAKTVVSNVVAFGASKVVAHVIAANTAPENMKDKVLIVAGSFAIGGLVADAAKKYTDNFIDETVAFYYEHIKPELKK